jgi:hypothetical protein
LEGHWHCATIATAKPQSETAKRDAMTDKQKKADAKRFNWWLLEIAIAALVLIAAAVLQTWRLAVPGFLALGFGFARLYAERKP